MTRPAASASPPAPAPPAGPSLRATPVLVPVLIAGGTVCLALVTLATPGATRMFSWPWSLAFAGVLLAPALVLVLRAFDRRRPLALPAPAWLVPILATAATILVSALASPHRHQSLLWGAPLLAGIAVFLLVFDGLHAGSDRVEAQRERLENLFVALFALVACASIGLWLAHLPRLAPGAVFDARNPFPLGHSNYTAGLALLMLPTAVAMAVRRRGRWRFAAATLVVLSLAMLFTSGSRGGFLGLAVLAMAALIAAPISRRQRWQLAALGAIAGLAFAVGHPRTRAMFARPASGAAPNISNVQRQAMLTAAWRMGADRPLLGWGPGTTPLVFPRYRAGLNGGAENVLQLHCLPAHLWAELGAAGVACLLAFAALMIRAATRHPVAAATLGAYGVFALTDWQLDVPVFAAVVAAFAALLAPPALPAESNPIGYSSPRVAAFAALPAPPTPSAASNPIGYSSPRVAGGFIAGFALVALGCVALLGRRDPAPERNLRALALAREPAGVDRAIALFRESLALNPDQEIAHFNLGWLLVVRDPAAAERHFHAAAHLVPDKGGVYFGLGLARLNQGRRDAAARAFALECLNDPLFLTSPWWREPAIAIAREATSREFSRAIARVRSLLTEGTWAFAQLTRLAEATSRLGHATAGPERSHRRERTGYPVLMRNLDLTTPVDLFDVRESQDTGTTAATLPPKGWLPSPLLLTLLNEPAPAND
ncbi:MAG: O-antigen ligase family protein [Verrucomicrobia bacterium]|nr:O-antigen ligase family protein [Verrucomicrobiota bacterium]